MGFSAKRVSQAVLTLKDTQTDIVEPRAVTLVNFADVSDMWVSRAEDVTDVVLTEDVKLTVLFEIRENSSRPPHWQLYSEKKAFATFCEATVQAIEDKEQAIWFPVVAKEGYMFRKAIFPAKWRNLVYAHSGRMSVSVKMLRNGEEKLEKGLDLIRLPRNNGHDMHSIWEAGHGQKGFLGAFCSPTALFIRIDDDSLEEARSIWLAGDMRWNSDNRGLKLKEFYKVQGFMGGTNLVDAGRILKEAGWVTVPLKSFHHADLTTVVVGSDRAPPQTKFMTNIGSIQVVSVDAIDPVPMRRASRWATKRRTNIQRAKAQCQSLPHPVLQQSGHLMIVLGKLILGLLLSTALCLPEWIAWKSGLKDCMAKSKHSRPLTERPSKSWTSWPKDKIRASRLCWLQLMISKQARQIRQLQLRSGLLRAKFKRLGNI